jgi:hypothetical protein
VDTRLVDLNEAVRVTATVAGLADRLVQLAMAFQVSNCLELNASLTSALLAAVPAASVVGVALLALRGGNRVGGAVDRRGNGQQRGDEEGESAELHFERV